MSITLKRGLNRRSELLRTVSRGRCWRTTTVYATSALLLSCASREEDLEIARDAVQRSTTVVQIRSAGADASFVHTDPTGCIQTGVFVVAEVRSDGPIPAPGVQEAELNLVVGQGDVCQHVTLLDGAGTSFDATIEITPDLRSAHVTGTVSVADFVSGTVIDFTVDLTWTASGPMTSGGGVLKTELPGSLIIERLRTKSRDAIATGTVSDGTTNFAEQGSVTAEIVDGSQGTVEVTFAH